MSAICGIVGVDGRPWTEADLEGVVRALAPLGPDGGGGWAGAAGRCGVAVAAALRTSTPEDAADRQPAVGRSGSLVLVGDLRVDNRAELAPSLGLADERSVPDSAFALAAYERWGDAMPERVIGDFALAIVDRRRGGVLIVRDHAGTRPLVVHERPGVVAFASTSLALTALEGVGHRLDLVRAAETLAILPSPERTFVEGVRWLPAGAALWVDDARIRQWTWWIPERYEAVDLGSPAAYERELREALDHAVAPRLRSMGAVGVSTSGGLDSTSVAASAARLISPEPLLTYTSAPPPGWHGRVEVNLDADESPLVLKLAERHRNIRPTFIHVPQDGGLFHSHEAFWELGAGPVRYVLNWLWLHAIRIQAGADGVTSLLSGLLGNLYFSADGPRWLVSLVRSGRIATACREIAAWTRATGDGPVRTVRQQLVSPLLPGPVHRLARAARGRMQPVQAWAAAIVLRPEIVADLDLAHRVPALGGPRSQDLRVVAPWVIQHVAEQADTEAAVAALTGVEERDPTGDRRVLEAALRQPEWVRRHDGLTRAVARGAMADRLPAEIAQRTRVGEQLPDWLDVMTAARPELIAELDELKEHPASRELIDVERLQRLVDRWPDRTAAADPIVHRHCLALARALLLSKYLRWFEQRASASQA